MADKIKGITIEINGDTTELNKTLNSSNKEIRSTKSELIEVEEQLKLDPSNVELLQKKQKLFSEAIQETEKKLETLRIAEKQVQQQFQEGKVSQEQYDSLKSKIAATEKSLKQLEKQAGKSELDTIRQSLSSANKELRSTQSQLNDVNRLLKLDPSNTELLQQKHKLLAKSVEETKKKLDLLKEAEKQVEQQFKEGKTSQEQYDAIKREIIATEQALENLEDQAADSNVALQKIGQAGEKIKDVSGKIKGAGEKLLPVTASIVGAGVAAVKSADDVRSAVNSYLSATGEYQDGTEQATEAATQFDSILRSIYKGNYGENLEDIAQSAAAIKNNMRQLSSDELQKTVETAITLRDTFGYDIPESARAANTMMDQFGVSADEAFNLITQGAQKGLDFSGELIDNINEYSVQFHKLGFTAEDMFNIFVVGSKNGAFNLDKIGDAVKELSIRVIDGSDTTKQGFEAAGLNAKKMSKEFAIGGERAKEAFKKTLQGLKSIENPLKRNEAGINLFGTMWEDLGETVVLSMADAEKSIDATSDAVEKLKEKKYDDIKNRMATIGRSIQMDIIIPLGEQLIPHVERAISEVTGLVQSFSALTPEMQKNVIVIAALTAGLGPLLIAIGQVGTGIGTLMTGAKSLGAIIGGLGAAGGPVVLTVSALTALSMAFVGMKVSIDRYRKTASALTEEQENNREKVESLHSAYTQMEQQRSEASLNAQTEAERERELFQELQGITSENGKIKSGYEERAKVITGELSDALGTEIKLTGNQISNYRDLCAQMDELILKKQANALLSANESAYATALVGATDATVSYFNALADVQEAEQALSDAQQHQADLREELNQKIRESSEAGEEQVQGAMSLYMEMEKASASVEGCQEKLDSMNATLADAEAAYTGYNTTIANYEGLSAAIISGDQEKIQEAVTNATYNFQTAETATRETLEKQVQSFQDKYDEMQRAIESGAPPIVQKQAEEMKNMVDRSKAELEKLPAVGSDFSNGLAEGIASGIDAVSSAATSVAKTGVEAVKTELDSHSPSRVMRQVGTDYVSGFVLGMTDKESEIKSTSTKIADQSSSGIKALIPKAGIWGKDMMTGYIQGIRSKMSELRQVSQSIATTVYDYIHFSRPEKGPLRDYEKWMPDMMKGLANGIRSNINEVGAAAEETASKIGEELASGLVESVRKNKAYAKKSSAEIADAVLDAAEKKLKNYKVYNDMTLKEEVDFWDAVRQQVKEGTQARIDADESYLTAKKNLNEKLKSAEEKYTDSIAKAYENLNEKIQDLNEEYWDAVDDRASEIRNAFGLFDEFDASTELTSEDLLNNLESQVEGLKDWRRNLETLDRRDIGDDLLQELQDLGPKSAAQIKLLTEMTDDQLDDYVSLFKQKNKIARNQAVRELEPMKEDIRVQISELRRETSEELEEYQKEYIESMTELGIVINKPAEDIKLTMAKGAIDMVATLASSIQTESEKTENVEKFKAIANNILNATNNLPADMQWIGENAIAGIIIGLQSKASELYEAAREISQNVTETIADAFEIHSPSVVMREKIGKNLMLGIQEGMEKYQGMVSLSNAFMKGATTLTDSQDQGNQTSNLEGIVEMLHTYLPDIASQKNLVLDGRVIVGQTVNRMDQQLADVQYLKGRIG